MIYISDTLFLYCPFCGQVLKWDRLTRDDFYNGAPFTCDCGAHFQHLPTPTLETALRSGTQSQNETIA